MNTQRRAVFSPFSLNDKNAYSALLTHMGLSDFPRRGDDTVDAEQVAHALGVVVVALPFLYSHEGSTASWSEYPHAVSQLEVGGYRDRRSVYLNYRLTSDDLNEVLFRTLLEFYVRVVGPSPVAERSRHLLLTLWRGHASPHAPYCLVAFERNPSNVLPFASHEDLPHQVARASNYRGLQYLQGSLLYPFRAEPYFP